MLSADSPSPGPSRRREIPESDGEEQRETRPSAKRRRTPRNSQTPAPVWRPQQADVDNGLDDDVYTSDNDLADLNSDSGDGSLRSRYLNGELEEDEEGGEENDQQEMDDHIVVKRETHANGGIDDDEEDNHDGGHRAVNGNGHAGPVARGQVQFRPDYERHDDGFVAGSIVRIRCRGFMTYDDTQCFPGPHLNVILGPNGSGKSSIAAVIAIGLGFPPKIMGRANDLKSYVRQGSEQGETEIELKNRKGKKNIVINRRFNRDDDKSEWFINGVPSTHKAVKTMAEDFGIQADNLCSFLAQDKVADFAKMAPVKVLEETIKAAGDPRLSNWHQTLIDKGSKARNAESARTTHTVERDNLQVKVDEMAPQVEQFHQRKEQEREREILQCLVPIAEMKAYSKRQKEVKREHAQLRAKVDAAGLKRKPINELELRQKKLQEHAEEQSNKAQEDLKGWQKQTTSAKRRMDDASREVQEDDEQLKSLKRKAKKNAEDKHECQRRIDAAKAILEIPKHDVDAEIAAKKKEKREVAEELKRAEVAYAALQQKNREEEDRLGDIRRRIDELAKHLQKVNSVEITKENKARDADGSINWVLNWLEENGNKLEGKVHKPPMISVNVRDKELAWQIEACTSFAQRSTFICESRKDYDTLVALLYGHFPERRDASGTYRPGGKIRFNVQLVEVNERTVNPPRPCTKEDLSRLGFAGFAVDLIEAAPAVIAFLNSSAKLHMSAISRLPGDQINSDEAIKLGLPVYVTATDVNRIVRASYGRRDHQLTQTPPIQARAFNLTIDRAAVEALVDEKAKLQMQLQEAEAPTMRRKEELKQALDKSTRIKKDLDLATNAAAEASSKLNKYYRAQQDYDSHSKRLADLNKRRDDEAEIERLRQTKLEHVKKLLRPIEDYSKAIEKSMDGIDSLVLHSFRALQHQLNRDAIEDKLNEGTEEEQDLRAELDRLEKNVADLTDKRDLARERSRTIISGKHVDVIRAIQDRAKADLDPDPDRIRQQLNAVEGDLEMSAGVDATFIARYEALERQLAEKKRAVADDEKILTRLTAQIDGLLEMFDPALNTLVGDVSRKFGAAFEKVGCSGEVKIDRQGNDFAKWGIQILVSYRDDEPLQILTAHRQSGGERALATVTYIMSLSEMARTPFSLVDEINQGMDQRSERNVHNQLVGVTCAPGAGQYFLITPKLLTNLEYNDRMKVLIVNNGTWLPDGRDKKTQWGNLGDCLKLYERSIAAH